ncbi:hypothetical protein KI659_08745 [Litoribacter alkaliphilus]|uniref:TonB-dependent receptor n=1 Tax=Litoribacter ruber TaxID=702568 RepID=A0AAP2CI50_9BACT|nr:hypothetical protein [Litoribacter alkaliphilus]MBS9524099.1 hypothetical protein [Litoribacter alkaliphilus]
MIIRTVIISVIFILGFIPQIYGQAILSGKVLYKQQNIPVFGVNVLVKDPEGKNTMTFGVTDDKGQFLIQIQSESDSLLIEFRSLTIQEYQMVVSNVSQQILVEVEEAMQEIPEFTLKSIKNPITAKNDTISYSVEGFATPNDRVIADILKRLPGIEVLDNGRILYEGRGIHKFYIDGMDLLEGKYNLANKNLPADAVESVQVLENHQPLRVLDSLVFSDRASLNLKLKRKNVWVGTGDVGVGASPLLWEGKFSPMVFRNNLQMINTVQSNNSGKDIAEELEVLTLDDLKENVGSLAGFKPWFGIPDLFVPNLHKERFLFNESHLFSANVLKRNANKIEFRTNVSYLHDSQRQNGQVRTAFFLPMDTVSIQEDHHNRYVRRDLEAELSWIKNEKKGYIKNRLQLNVQNNVELGLTHLNEIKRNQKANLPLVSISNKFHTLKPVGRQLVDVRSDVTFRRANQSLSISPGGFEQQLTEGVSFERLVQNLESQTFFLNNSIGLTKGLGKGWTYSGNAGLLYQLDVMESSLSTREGSEEAVQPFPYVNDISYQQVRTYLKSKFTLKQESFNFSFDIPMSYLNVQVKDPVAHQGLQMGRMIFEPQLFMKYDFTGKWNSVVRLKRKNDFKGVQDLHYGFILRNFRTFRQQATAVPEVVDHSLAYHLNYRDPINSFFANFNYTYAFMDFNTITENQVGASGEIVYRTLDLQNSGETHSLNLRSSKYMPLLFTNIILTGLFQHRTREQIINGDLAVVAYQVVGPGLELHINPKSVVNLSYKANFNFINSTVGENSLGRIQQLKQTAELDVFPVENHLLSVIMEVYDNRFGENKDLTGFLDLRYRYRIPQSKWDVSLHAQNILNNNNFGTFTADSFMIREQSFMLRPRQVLVNLNFSF